MRHRRLLFGGLALVAGTACSHGARSPGPPLPPPTVAVPMAPNPPSKTDSIVVSSAEVARLALAVFGDSAPTPVHVVEDDGPTFDIDVRSYETHERVEHYVALFTGDGHDRFVERLQAGRAYEGMVRAKLHAAGLPEDLYYLAMVESGFSPDAYSRAAAVGMWQFMSSTARSVGLRVDWWVDDRRDPAKSTDAAIRHLIGLRKEFDGSLYLAAAAYNGGSSRISRGLTRYADELEGVTGDAMFFALADQPYLREETRNYVPQLIAVTLVAKNAIKYGMKTDSVPPYVYDSVRVGPSVPLASVARAGGISLSDVGRLNPFILRGVTPPKDSIFVRVPIGARERVDTALAHLNVPVATVFTRVPSKTGETFAAVAKRLGLSAKQLAWYNPNDGVRKGKLSAGTTILVPSKDVLLLARDVPNPAIEIYKSTPVRRTISTKGAALVHLVKPGDTLGGIAKLYGVTVAALKSKNGLGSDVIRAGQKLIIR